MGLLFKFRQAVPEIFTPGHEYITAVLAGNDTFLAENITEDRKRFITQSKHILIFHLILIK